MQGLHFLFILLYPIKYFLFLELIIIKIKIRIPKNISEYIIKYVVNKENEKLERPKVGRIIEKNKITIRISFLSAILDSQYVDLYILFSILIISKLLINLRNDTI